MYQAASVDGVRVARPAARARVRGGVLAIVAAVAIYSLSHH